METESSPITPTHEVLYQADQVIGMAEQILNADPTSSSSPTPNPSQVTSATTTPSNPSAGVALASPQVTTAAFPTPSNAPDAVTEKITKKTDSAVTEKPQLRKYILKTLIPRKALIEVSLLYLSRNAFQHQLALYVYLLI